MRVIDPSQTSTADLYQYLVGVVNPRPIAFVSTVDAAGTRNLAPYSFFNCFSANPPVLVFSATRRAGPESRKDTLRNLEETGEAVINMVHFDIAHQMALTSVQVPHGTDEFELSGLTPIPADLVRPARVKESPVQMECRLRQVVPLGDAPGAGHLIICEVIRMHLAEHIFDEQGRVDPQRIDLVGRLGRAFYVRVHGQAVKRIFQDRNPPVVGFHGLPEALRHSPVLTGSELARLAGLHQPPAPEAVHALGENPEYRELLEAQDAVLAIQQAAKQALARDDVNLAARLAWWSTTHQT